MTIDKILQSPSESLIYMERVVNNGSPSLFSFKNTTSRETCPLYTSKFKVCTVKNLTSTQIEAIGVLPSELKIEYDKIFFLHPDWKNINVDFEVEDLELYVSPTSSSRTVKALWSDFYIKLYYPGILGRISRELKKEHILSSIDVTLVLSDLIEREYCPQKLSFFPERGGCLFHSKSIEIGYVIREAIPYGNVSQKIHALIPAFSLFAADRETNDLPIIIQLLNNKSNPIDYLLEQLIYPIIDIFFYCLFQGGLLLEMHSQNFLIGIDDNCEITSIVLRDLESVDKDLTIMEKFNLKWKLQSYPYKCIYCSQYNYLIKHSFMYDHKLGEYFFDQLLACLEKYGLIVSEKISNNIAEYVRHKYGVFLTNLFPKNTWYKFSNVLIDRSIEKRPYVCINNPKYR